MQQEKFALLNGPGQRRDFSLPSPSLGECFSVVRRGIGSLAVRSLVTAIAVSAWKTGPLVQAASISWKNVDSDFNTGTSWIGDAAPGSGDVAAFSTSQTINPTLSTHLTIQSLSFATSSNYTLSNFGGAVLSLTTEGSSDAVGTSAIRASNITGTNTISAPIILAGTASSTQSFSQAASGTLTVSGSLTNTNPLTLRLGGGGIIGLSGDNSTLTASLLLSTNTTFQIGSNTALGIGLLTVGATGTSVQSNASADRVVANPVALSTTTSTFGSSSTGNLTFGAMTLVGGNRTVTVNNSITVVSSLSPDATLGRSLTKQGAGALVVTGSKTNTGATTITGGALVIGGTFSSGNVSLNGGVLGLNGTFIRGLGTSATTTQWTDSGGFAAFGINPIWGNATNNLSVNIGNAGAVLNFGSVNFLASGKTLMLGSGVSTGTVTFQNGLDLAGTTQTIQVDRGAANLAGGSDSILSGGITNGSLTKTGLGTVTLSSAANTFSGATTINSGGVRLGAPNVLPNTSIVLNGGTLLSNGNSNTTSGTLHLGNSSAIDLSGGGSFTFAPSVGTWTGTLTVLNWSNATPINFGNSGGLDSTQLNQIAVFDGGFASTNLGAFTLDGGGTLVPVPEMGALLGGLGLLAPLAWRERRHWMRCREAR